MSASILLSKRRLQPAGNDNYTYKYGNSTTNITDSVFPKTPYSKGPKGAKSAFITDPSDFNFTLFYVSIGIIVIILILFIMKWIRKYKTLFTETKNRTEQMFLVMFVNLVVVFLIGDIVMLLTIHDSHNNFVIGQISAFFYRFGRAMMSLFFLFRLKLCFSGSVLEISTNMFYAVLAVIIISYIIWLMGFVFTIDADPENVEMQELYKDFEFASWIIDCVVNIIILWLFLRGIWRAIITSNANRTNDTLTKQRQSSLNFIVKNTNLAIWGLTSSMFPQLYGRLVQSHVISDDLTYHTAMAVDGTINIICIHLIFRFCEWDYGIICKCCHQCLGKFCKHFAEKSLIKNQSVNRTERNTTDETETRTEDLYPNGFDGDILDGNVDSAITKMNNTLDRMKSNGSDPTEISILKVGIDGEMEDDIEGTKTEDLYPTDKANVDIYT